MYKISDYMLPDKELTKNEERTIDRHYKFKYSDIISSNNNYKYRGGRFQDTAHVEYFGVPQIYENPYVKLKSIIESKYHNNDFNVWTYFINSISGYSFFTPVIRDIEDQLVDATYFFINNPGTFVYHHSFRNIHITILVDMDTERLSNRGVVCFKVIAKDIRTYKHCFMWCKNTWLNDKIEIKKQKLRPTYTPKITYLPD